MRLNSLTVGTPIEKGVTFAALVIVSHIDIERTFACAVLSGTLGLCPVILAICALTISVDESHIFVADITLFSI